VIRTLVVLALAALAGPAAAAPATPTAPAAPAVVAKASRAEVSVGERFIVEVRGSGPPGIAFAFPGDVIQEGFELHTMADSSARAPGGRAAGRTPAEARNTPPGTHRYRAALFAIGDAQIPPIPVRYRLADGTIGEIATAPIPLRVVSLLPKDQDQQKLADVRGPVGLSLGRAFWIGLVALILLLGALAWWIVSRRRRTLPEAAAPVVALEPDDEARRALDALVASGRIARGEYRPFYIELTAIAKRYLERRLGAPIVEMTTAETLAHLRATPAAEDQATVMRDLTGAADQIKFAKGLGLLEESERHLAATRRMVDELERRLRPVVPEGGQAA